MKTHPKDKNAQIFFGEFFGEVWKVLRKSFGSICPRHSAPAILGPRDAEHPELYEHRKPYERANPPPDLRVAEARYQWNQRRVEDWKRRGAESTWKRILKEVKNGTYAERAHTYKGRVESVMGAAAREMLFLERWMGQRRKRFRRRSSAKPRQSQSPIEWFYRDRRNQRIRVPTVRRPPSVVAQHR